MKQLIPMDDLGVFIDMNDVARVDSRFVAQFFEKNHRDVLRSIRALIDEDSVLTEEFRLRNFSQSTYINEQGHKQPCFYLTRDGFALLAMGFTGKKAVQFKELYIKRFNEMEKFISDLVSARTQFPKLTAQIHMLHPDAKPYHYSNECDMLNRIVLGMTAKQFREKRGIEKGKSIRPYLRDDQIAMLDLLQTFDIGFVAIEPDYQKRKENLERMARMYAGKFGTTNQSIALPVKAVN